MANGEPETMRRKISAALLWIAAFLPALIVLGAVLRWRVPVPYHDSWAFVKQYQAWSEGTYGWREFFAPHNAHPSAAGKAVYFLVLRCLRGDVGILPLVSWALSLAISLGVLALSRPLWRDRPERGAGMMFLANLSIFGTIQGHAWIWDFVFQNYIPGACLVLGLLALSGPRVAGWRWVAAALLALVSAFSFGTGFAVGFLLLPAAALAVETGEGRRRMVGLLGGAVACGAIAWTALHAFGQASGGSSPAGLLARPVSSLGYILALLGHTLGRGTALEPVVLCGVWGTVLAVGWIAGIWGVARLRDRELWRQSWPWVAFGLWAALNAAAICVGRFRATLETGMAHRYGTFMLFLPLGVLFLVATLRQRGALPVWAKRWMPVALGLLLAAHVSSWISGWQAMELFHRRMVARKASLDFIDAVPSGPGAFWQLELTPEAAGGARYLLAHDRLRDVRCFPDAAAVLAHRGAALSAKWAGWRLVSREGGVAEMRGTCGLSKELGATADLIVITMSPPGGTETIVALVPPETPEDFWEHGARRREHYEHYFGWRWPVDRARVPEGADATLRVYLYDSVKRKVRPVEEDAKAGPAPR